MRASRSRQKYYQKQNDKKSRFLNLRKSRRPGSPQFEFLDLQTLNLRRPRIFSSGQKSRSVQNPSFSKRRFKLGLRAKGLSLLSLALRPGLLGIVVAVGVFGVNSLIGDNVSAASLTLSVPSSTLSLEIEPNNQFKKSSESSITAKTDALAGYTLKIKSKSEANSLVNSDTSVKLNSLSTKVSEADYQNDGNTNTWGYKPKKFESVENSDFLPGPTAEESIIDQTSAKNDSENSYSITLGAKVDATLPTGIYTNTFVFLASANSFNYTIKYDPQSGTGGPSSPQTGSTVDPTIKLDSSTPTKSGYEFQGWCSTTPTNNNTTNPSCSGKTYQPGGDYTFTDANSSTLTLHAVWKSSVFYMQDFYSMSSSDKTAYINKMTTNTQYEMVDKRDNKTYYVAKLADGNVWMTENLDFDINGSITYTPEDTDIKDNWRPSKGTYSGATWANTTIEPRSMDPGNICWDGTSFYSGSGVSISTNTKSCSQHDPSHYYVGNYYNFIASAAMNTKPSNTVDGQDADQSVCPAGWRIPVHSGSKSLSNLISVAGLTSGPSGNIHLPPNYFNYTGHWNGNTYYTYLSSYWTNTLGSTSYAYYAQYSIGSNSFSSSTYAISNGYTLRCIVR